MRNVTREYTYTALLQASCAELIKSMQINECYQWNKIVKNPWGTILTGRGRVNGWIFKWNDNEY